MEVIRVKPYQKQKRLTKTELRRDGRKVNNDTPPPASSASVVDFYPDIHPDVEDLLFDVSKEPLIGRPDKEDE